MGAVNKINHTPPLSMFVSFLLTRLVLGLTTSRVEEPGGFAVNS